MNGTAGSLDCSGLDGGNTGCGVIVPGKSFGGAFNDNGGGIYAVYRNLHKRVTFSFLYERFLTFLCSSSTIQSWFWPRNVNPPADVAVCEP
jgi:hypothetical protein